MGALIMPSPDLDARHKLISGLRKTWTHIETVLIVIVLAPFTLVAWPLMLWPGKGAFR